MAQSKPPGAQQRFLDLIKQDILKLDLAELDFGIYRILNYRRKQVLGYLDDTLPGRISQWIDALHASSARELAESEAANCYYHLHTFFARYWEDGDFIPRARRGGSPAYAVPYNGQDTHFHWATKGSHYVKSGELFSRYAYRDGTHEVRFTVERADTEKDNAKGGAKHFFPASMAGAEGGFELRWQWRAATDAENKRYKSKSAGSAAADDEGDQPGTATAPVLEGGTLQERVLNSWLTGADFKPAKPSKGLDPTLLASNARRFVRKNTSDFFVHPQLGVFLRGELDVYLKHEFVQVWDAPDLELPRIRAKFKLVRDIARDLIAFLDQIERFQATLFEKRKFVLQADYLAQCSWLLREGGDDGEKLVGQACANASQVKEWASWVGDISKKPIGRKLLNAYPHLPLHTRHFDASFKARLLACFPDIEAALGGELIHADNYAALRTLEPAYRDRVKCIYIDPPYNTDASPILYKNEFKEASWLALIQSRVNCALGFMSQSSAFCLAIDDFELARVTLQLFEIFGEANHWATVPIRSKPQGRATTTGFSVNHDYALFFAKNAESAVGRMPREGSRAARYRDSDSQGRFSWSNFRKTGSDSLRTDRPGQFYPVYVAATSLRIPKMTWQKADKTWKCESLAEGEVAVWPIDEDGLDRVWSVANKRAAQEIAVGDIVLRANGNGPSLHRKYRPNEDGALPNTWWSDASYSASESGTKVLQDMGIDPTNLYPKSIHAVVDCLRVLGCWSDSLVLDFFGGTGTTAHAIINLNREDGGARKFLLAEQGEYFDTVTLPRIAKVMAAPEWKDGTPRDSVKHADAGDPDHWSRRTLPLVRVLRLERYEDSLNALEFDPGAVSGSAQAELGLRQHDAQSHLLRYWLMEESEGHAVRLSTAKLCDPFSYQLTLHEPAGERVVDVDLMETARLLLGLAPKRQRETTDALGRRHQLMEAVLASDLARSAADPQPLLLWLRAVDDERDMAMAKAEHDWLAAQVLACFGRALDSYATIFHNRGAFWPAGERGASIDSLLADSMMERAR